MEKTLIYHYTSLSHLIEIFKVGKLHTSQTEKMLKVKKPGLWFTTNSKWEHSAFKRFNDGNFFKIEEVNIHFKAKNPRSKFATLISTADKLDFLKSKRLDNIDKNKPINSGLPDSYEESKVISEFIEVGESREVILNYFQRSESVINRIIKEKLDGQLEDNDPYVIAAKKILGHTDNS